ncbi:hypothetical protein ACWFRM_22240 [Streptomyces sp. NPDC055144]
MDSTAVRAHQHAAAEVLAARFTAIASSAAAGVATAGDDTW